MVSFHNGLTRLFIPLNARQNRSHVICRTPSVLQDIQTQLSGSVDIRVKHLADEFDARWFIRILLLKVHN